MPVAIINALIVLPPEIGARVTTLRFDARRILSLDQPPQRGDMVHDLSGRALYPGLINAHDHLELNHYPRSKFRPVYPNAHEWGHDFLPKLAEEPYRTLRKKPLEEQCNIGGIKNLRSGVTLVAHHNPLHAPLKASEFPIRVLQRYGWAHSLHFEPKIKRSYRRTPRGAVWMIHLAEGTDQLASAELQQLQSLGCLKANTLLIHGVALSAEDRRMALTAGAGLIWCPSTNYYLLGTTGDVRDFAAARRLAIGTDSRLTADGDMLDELRAAAKTGQMDVHSLFRAVTTDAANLLRVRGVGALLPNYLPDFFVAPAASDPYAALLTFTPHNIEAVYVGGILRYQR